MAHFPVSETLQEWRESAPYWEKHRHIIEMMFAPVARALIEGARIARGHSVLDVAAGPGEPSLTIAEAVGPTGFVMCTDAVVEMVAAAESEARRRGIDNIQFRQCVADSLPFEVNSFDAVVSRLGAMFFPNPPAALREMLRVTKPGGMLSLAVWPRSELNPFSYIVTNILSRYVETPATDRDAPGAFRFAEEGKLASILRSAGATDVGESLLHFRIAAPISPAEFWAMRSETSETLRTKLATLSAQQVSHLAAEIRQATSEFFPDNQMSFPAQMIIVTGRKP